MPRDYHRADRVADAVQRILATVIPREMEDPRLSLVNINAVSVSRDLAYAKVYVTFVGETDKAVCEGAVRSLNSAGSFLRTLVGKELTMRTAPRLQFYFDESSLRGQALDDLIEKALAKDAQSRSRDE